jgi:hypothetical protein
MKLEFSRQIFKNSQISNFMKIRPVGAELFQAEGQTDGQTVMTKPLVSFRNFTNAPKNLMSIQKKICLYDRIIKVRNDFRGYNRLF